MKRQITLGLIGWLLASIGGYKALAQEKTNTDSKESQEIIIRKKGDKDTKVMVEITGDKVIVNGKPLAEFNEDGVTINNRKMIVRDGNKIMLDLDGKMLDLDGKFDELKELQNLKNFSFNWNDNNEMDFGDETEYTYLGVSTAKNADGALVTAITKGSPAEKAGLEKNDIIYKLDDTKIGSTTDLSEMIRGKKDGDKVKVYFLREGKKKDVKAVLGTQKRSGVRSFSFSTPDGKMRSFSVPGTPRPPSLPRIPAVPRVYGNDDMFNMDNDRVFTRRQKLGLKIRDTEENTGVTVLEVEPASAAAAAGLMKDDVITEIGGRRVTTTDEAREELQENKDKSTYAVKAKRNGAEMTFNIKIPKNLKTATL